MARPTPATTATVSGQPSPEPAGRLPAPVEQGTDPLDFCGLGRDLTDVHSVEFRNYGPDAATVAELAETWLDAQR